MTDPASERAAIALFEAMLDVVEGDRNEWLAQRTSNNAPLLSKRALLEAHGDINLDKAGKSVTEALRQLSAVPQSLYGPEWRSARSDVRRSQLELALLNGDADALRSFADKLAREANERASTSPAGYGVRLDQALAEHYLGLAGYLSDNLDEGVAHFVASDRLLAAIAKDEPNEPNLLYLRAFNAYTGHGTADGLPDKRREASMFLRTATDSVDQLLAVEPHDAAIRSFAAAVKQASARDLSARGLYAQAIKAQSQVIENYVAANRRNKSAGTANKLVGAYQTLALISDDAGDKEQACVARTQAIITLDQLRKAGDLLGSVKAMEEEIRAELKAC